MKIADLAGNIQKFFIKVERRYSNAQMCSTKSFLIQFFFKINHDCIKHLCEIPSPKIDHFHRFNIESVIIIERHDSGYKVISSSQRQGLDSILCQVSSKLSQSRMTSTRCVRTLFKMNICLFKDFLLTSLNILLKFRNPKSFKH